MSSYVDFVILLLIFVAVLVATYFFTKWMAGFQREKTSTGNIEVIETARISTTKYIQIIRIGEKYVAIGVGKDEITNLGEISEDGLVLKDASASGSQSFKEILEKFKGEKKK